jgi:hypothetical protein
MAVTLSLSKKDENNLKVFENKNIYTLRQCNEVTYGLYYVTLHSFLNEFFTSVE